jgi:hypothetical protein
VIGIMRGKSSDPAKVCCDRAIAECFELDNTGVFLIPLAGSDDVMLTVFFP